MKFLYRFVFAVMMAVVFTGCSMFSFLEEVPISDKTVAEIQPNLKLGMSYEQILELLNVPPEWDANGTPVGKFKLVDGDLWIRFSGTREQLGEAIFWGTVTRLPDGTTVKKTSKQQALEKMLNNPICIDIDITTMLGGKNRFGKCYYEQYGPGNIVVKASEKGAKDKKVSLVYVHGKYVLIKGNVPPNAEFKYLAGYLANLRLLQSLVAKGMAEATPVQNGRRNFSYESQKEPLVVHALDKKIIYPAPWDVRGFVEPTGKNKGFNFDINFSVTWATKNGKSIQDTNFKGSFHQKKQTFGENINLNEFKQFYVAAPGDLKPLTVLKKDFTEFSN